MPRPRAAFLKSFRYVLWRGFVHGSTAPWLRDLLLSGMTRSRSRSMVLPKPWHLGHAPKGLLKENSRGSGSSYRIPHVLHSNASLKRNRFCCGVKPFPEGHSATSRMTSPLFSRKHVSTE